MSHTIRSSHSSRIYKPSGTNSSTVQSRGNLSRSSSNIIKQSTDLPLDQGSALSSFRGFSRLPRTKRFSRPCLTTHTSSPAKLQTSPSQTAAEPASTSSVGMGKKRSVSSFEKISNIGNTGNTVLLSSLSPVTSVPEALKHGVKTLLSPLPAQRTGLSSTRIAEILQFRARVPPVLGSEHVHALLGSGSVEREIDNLVAKGEVRRIRVLGRGKTGSDVGEYLVERGEMDKMIRERVERDIADRFLAFLDLEPRAASILDASLCKSDLTALRRAGFLVSAGLVASSGSVSSFTTLGRSVSTGTAEMSVVNSIHDLDSGDQPLDSRTLPGTELLLSLPNMGPYLRLVENGRSHLLELLKKSPSGQVPLSLLRERWDGAVESDSRVSQSKRIRGEFSGLLPGRTRKWKQLYGMEFTWILEECVSMGMMELFDTKSVGHGVRAV